MTKWPHRSAPASWAIPPRQVPEHPLPPARRLGFVTVTRSEVEVQPEGNAI